MTELSGCASPARLQNLNHLLAGLCRMFPALGLVTPQIPDPHLILEPQSVFSLTYMIGPKIEVRVICYRAYLILKKERKK